MKQPKTLIEFPFQFSNFSLKMWFLLIALLVPCGETSKSLIIPTDTGNEIFKAATVFLVNKYFAQNDNWRTRFIIRTEKPDFELQEFMSEILMKTNAKLVYDININTYPDNYCRVFFVDSSESLDSFIIHTNNLYVSFCQYRLIVLKVTDKSKNYYDEMLEIVRRFFTKFSLVDVNILIEPIPGSIFLYTYFPYSEQHCRPPYYPVKIDEFDTNRRIFPNVQYHYVDKTKDFFSCVLNVGFPIRYSPMVFFNGTEIWGIEGEMVSLIAERKNFKMNLTVIDHKRDLRAESDKLVRI